MQIYNKEEIKLLKIIKEKFSYATFLMETNLKDASFINSNLLNFNDNEIKLINSELDRKFQTIKSIKI